MRELAHRFIHQKKVENQNGEMKLQGLSKTLPINKKIPTYSQPLSRSIIATGSNMLLATIKLDGIGFESETNNTIQQNFEAVRNVFLLLNRQYAPNLGVWTHIVKKKDSLANVDKYHFNSTFVNDFTKKYFSTFKDGEFFTVEYYITFVLNASLSKDVDSALAAMNDVITTVSKSLKKYSPQLLQLDDDTNRLTNVEFLSYLMNHNDNDVIPLSSKNIASSISSSDLYFGYDVCEIRNANNSSIKYAAFYELDSYPDRTKAGMFDFILKHKGEFVLTQSMIMTTAHDALHKTKQQINKIASSDKSAEDLAQLQIVSEGIASSDIAFGDYHFALAVFSNSESQCLDDGAELSGEFSSKGVLLKRANLNNQFQFLSQFPASSIRPVSHAKTTTNLACGFSLHNYSKGKQSGNPIGDGSALIPLKTTSNSLFYLNCHASEADKYVTGQKYAGHTLLLGASGTGKTTLAGTLTLFLTRFEPQIFAIDYNRSTELYIRAVGGEYFAIQEGVDTGLNPFQLDDTPELRSFLYRLVNSLASESVEDEKELKSAIDSVMDLPHEHRRLSMVLQSVQNYQIRTRLEKWCQDSGGSLGWCFDSVTNRFDPKKADRVGFDTTLLLEVGTDGKPHPATESILAVLFFLKEQMQQEGRLLLTIVEEFWMPASFPLTEALMKKILKAGRLRNEFMILASQSPEDAINCNIFTAIRDQTKTKIFLPNPDAEEESYLRCGLTQGEFEKVKMLGVDSRTFLVKQSHVSSFAKLDLYGFDDFLPIISGTTDNIFACEKIRTEVGSDPEHWIPALQQYLKKD